MEANVIMYTTPACGQCKALHAWMEKNDITVSVCDITTDFKAKALLVAKGITSVPVIKINDTLIVDSVEGLKSAITDLILNIRASA